MEKIKLYKDFIKNYHLYRGEKYPKVEDPKKILVFFQDA